VGAYLEWHKSSPPETPASPAVSLSVPPAASTLSPVPAPATENAPPPASPAPPATPSAQVAAPPPAATTAPPPVSASVPAEKTASADAAPKAKKNAGSIELTVGERSWIDIRDRSQVLLLGNFAAGSRQSVSGVPPFRVVIGNAKGVKLSYNGKAVDVGRYQSRNIARFNLN